MDGAPQGAPFFLDLAGWMLFAVCLLLPFVVPAFARHRRLGTVFFVAMLLRQILTVHRAYLTLPMSDAGDLHRQALGQGDAVTTNFGIGAHAYINLLGRAYEILGESWFAGQQLSNVAFALACVALVKLMREIGVKRYEPWLLGLFALPLSVLRYTSDTVRESYQILFFVLAVLMAVRFKHSGAPRHYVAVVASALAMGFFHDGLIVYSMLLIALVTVWPSPRSYGKPRWRATRTSVRLLLFLAPFVAIGVFLGGRIVARGIGGAPAVYALVSGGALEYAAKYRAGGMRIQARTTYGVALDTSSPLAFAATLSLAIAHYMAGPFPWEIRAPTDVYGAMESLLRILLIVFAIRTVREWPPGERRIGTLLLALYFTLAVIWAVGTVNYGTAIRHHITTNWIVLALGGPAMIAWLRRLVSLFFANSARSLPAAT